MANDEPHRSLADSLEQRWLSFGATNAGRRTIRAVRWTFTAGVLALLVYQLHDIGWSKLWASVPTNPWIYVIFGWLYIQLTVAEIVAYRSCWRFDLRQAIPAFLKKRIYNRDVLGYSGEVYFFSWARKHVQDRSSLQLAETIRDQNIVSSSASTAVALVLLGVYLNFGTVNLDDQLGSWLASNLARVSAGGVVLTVVASVAIVGVVVRFRRYLFRMSPRLAAGLFLLHTVRLVIGQATQVSFWAVGVPDVPLQTWLTFAAASIIASRIPLLPNRDLLFVSAGIAMSDALDLESAGIGTIFAFQSVLTKVVNVILFSVISVAEPSSPARSQELADAAARRRVT
ncbi:MAG: hypothetical protein B7733_20885 [Myxococcales bacterium FL481]|nr:MAG: hypothetical protein B7733_20885 [Myxococcales bacterium FL481]